MSRSQPRLWATLLAFASRASATAPALHCNLVATIAPHASITLSTATAVAAVNATVRIVTTVSTTSGMATLNGRRPAMSRRINASIVHKIRAGTGTTVTIATTSSG